MTTRFTVAIFSVFLFLYSVPAQSSYDTEITKWRADHQAEQLTDDGWFSIAGLFWLKEGINTIGVGDKFDIELTDNFKQGKFGEIVFSKGRATLNVAPGVDAKSGNEAVTSMDLVSDEKGKPSKIDIGSQTIYLIRRENGYGIRLKDTKNAARVNFTGLKWYSIDPKLKIVAKFEPFAEPKEVDIPNVLGGNYKMMSSGILRFKLHGKEYTLMPVTEDDHLFIIFRDLTSRTETYGAGRFLYAAEPKDGRVILDFNKAENPPCAYTSFATCPLPPQQNRLEIEIKAGEKRYHH